MIPLFYLTAFSPHPHFILAKRSVEAPEAKIRPEMPFEPTPQDLLQEAEPLLCRFVLVTAPPGRWRPH